MLLRGPSAGDTEHLSRGFSHGPAALMREGWSFGRGEGLTAGRIAAHPAGLPTAPPSSVGSRGNLPATWVSGRDG